MAATQTIRGTDSPRAPRGEAESLPARLRHETAALHARVEAATGLPGSIRRRDEYTVLLQRLHRFHSAVEARLSDADWSERWTGLGIDLAGHRRSALLADDLRALRAPVPERSAELTGIDSFPGALGCLYVTEGSSLGGRIIGPAIRSTVGDIPTAFFDSAGRRHPSPWRALTQALGRYGDADGDAEAVIEGARLTFLAFESQVAAAPQSEVAR